MVTIRISDRHRLIQPYIHNYSWLLFAALALYSSELSSEKQTEGECLDSKTLELASDLQAHCSQLITDCLLKGQTGKGMSEPVIFYLFFLIFVQLGTSSGQVGENILLYCYPSNRLHRILVILGQKNKIKKTCGGKKRKEWKEMGLKLTNGRKATERKEWKEVKCIGGKRGKSERWEGINEREKSKKQESKRRNEDEGWKTGIKIYRKKGKEGCKGRKENSISKDGEKMKEGNGRNKRKGGNTERSMENRWKEMRIEKTGKKRKTDRLIAIRIY